MNLSSVYIIGFGEGLNYGGIEERFGDRSQIVRRKDGLVSSSELARENEQKVVQLIRAHFWTRRGIIKHGGARKGLGTHESAWVPYPGLFLFSLPAAPSHTAADAAVVDLGRVGHRTNKCRYPFERYHRYHIER